MPSFSNSFWSYSLMLPPVPWRLFSKSSLPDAFLTLFSNSCLLKSFHWWLPPLILFYLIPTFLTPFCLIPSWLLFSWSCLSGAFVWTPCFKVSFSLLPFFLTVWCLYIWRLFVLIDITEVSLTQRPKGVPMSTQQWRMWFWSLSERFDFTDLLFVLVYTTSTMFSDTISMFNHRHHRPRLKLWIGMFSCPVICDCNKP